MLPFSSDFMSRLDRHARNVKPEILHKVVWEISSPLHTHFDSGFRVSV